MILIQTDIYPKFLTSAGKPMHVCAIRQVVWHINGFLLLFEHPVFLVLYEKNTVLGVNGLALKSQESLTCIQRSSTFETYIRGFDS